MNFKETLKEYLTIKGISQKELAELLGDSQQAISDFLSKKSNPRKKTREKYFNKLVGFEDFYKQKTSLDNVNLNETPTIYKPEGKIIDSDNLPQKEVIVIPVKGRGGLENAFYDDLALNKMETEKLSLKFPSSNGSKWFKIEVEGVSMDDSTEDYEGSKYSLVEGDWVYCRSIPKIYWKSKLHFNSVKVFCFFHNTRGIIFKKVKSHDIETGEIELCSLNKDKKKFPNFKINVAECSYICNVIKVLSNF